MALFECIIVDEAVKLSHVMAIKPNIVLVCGLVDHVKVSIDHPQAAPGLVHPL
jgi:hypothetical protein